MSHKSKQTLRAQVNDRFKQMFTPGMSKHEAKQEARNYYNEHKSEYAAAGMNEKEAVDSQLRKHIYSYQTYDSYMKHAGYFVDWCKETYHTKTVDDCRQYADEWLKQRTDEGKSPYTLKLEAAALAKVYDEPATNFYKTPERTREQITRSRGTAARDYGFNIAKHQDIIDFGRGTGLRRSELTKLTGNALTFNENGDAFLHVRGKGGRWRDAPIIGQHASEIVSRCEAAGGDRVWPDGVPSHMDEHSYRSEYATAVYTGYARPIDEVKQQCWQECQEKGYVQENGMLTAEGQKVYSRELYFCRGSAKGTVYDRRALQEASWALGHNRVSVVAEHYIRFG